MPTRPGIKRLRMFAGPNGSGKSLVFKHLAREHSPSGVFWGEPFVNADEMEWEWRSRGEIDLEKFGLSATTEKLRAWLLRSSWAPLVRRAAQRATVAGAKVHLPRTGARAYVMAALADYLREELVRSRRSFTFETVMSHRSKVEFFARARAQGYRSYLYFVTTDDPALNVQRIRVRTLEGGHSVPKKKIIERFARTLALLPAAIRQSDRAYLFDNSGASHVLVAEVNAGRVLTRYLPAELEPAWFRRLLAGADYLQTKTDGGGEAK